MLDTLKILNRAVNKNGGIFASLCIDDGYVEANNGRISILAAVPELDGITATVPADKFISAVRACKGVMEIKTTDSSLIIKAGSFSARIPLNKSTFPRMDYSVGQRVDVPAMFVDKLATVQSFTTSPDFNGVLLRGDHIYGIRPEGAVALDGTTVPCDIVLPIDTVTDLIAIKEQPVDMRVSDSHAIISYDLFQVRTALIERKWPDTGNYLSFDTDGMTPVTDALREALTTVLPFIDNSKRVTFTGDELVGGEATMEDINMPQSSFNGEYLATVLKHSTALRITKNQQGHTVVEFIGDGIVGVMAGIRIRGED